MDDLAFPWVISCSQLGAWRLLSGPYLEHVRGAFLACERCRRRRYAVLIAQVAPGCPAATLPRSSGDVKLSAMRAMSPGLEARLSYYVMDVHKKP